MATSKPRVAGYVSQELKDLFQAFTQERELSESKALGVLLAEYFGVSQEVAHPTAFDLVKRIEATERRLSVLEGNLDETGTLSTAELAKRLGVDPTTLSHWKSGKRSKSPKEFLEATRKKDPDSIGWEWLQKINRFKPEVAISDSLSMLQGDLLTDS